MKVKLIKVQEATLEVPEYVSVPEFVYGYQNEISEKMQRLAKCGLTIEYLCPSLIDEGTIADSTIIYEDITDEE